MDSTTPALLQWAKDIAAIATPFLIIGLAGIGWFIKNQILTSQRTAEESRTRTEELEEGMRSDRLQVYTEVLQPFIILFTKDEAFVGGREQRGKPKSKEQRAKSKEQRIVEIMISTEYRQAGFKLSLFANDDVVRAYNNLMQYAFHLPDYEGATDGTEARSKEDNFRILAVFGDFLREIRKSVGNERTTLDSFEMLEWMIKDINEVRQEFPSR